MYRAIYFKVDKLARPVFPVKREDLLARHPIDWTSSSSAVLTDNLHKQVCNDLRDLEFCHLLYEDLLAEGKVEIFLPRGADAIYRPNPNTSAEILPKIIRCARDFREGYSRDQDAFAQESFDHGIYAVVLLDDKNEYNGHIYMWSPLDDTQTMLCMGIKKRLSLMFEDNRQPIAALLLESCRLVANKIGAKAISVVDPLAVMRSILPKLGFVKGDGVLMTGNGVAPSTFTSQYWTINSDQVIIKLAIECTIF